jgi:hypothetical protein
MSTGRLVTSFIAFHLIIMPSIGGTKINAKKTTIADRYTPYLTVFFDESLSKASVILGLRNLSPPK